MLQNKKTQPLTHFSNAISSERASRHNTSRLLKHDPVRVGRAVSAHSQERQEPRIYADEETHADVLIQDKHESYLHEKTDIQKTPTAGIPAPSSAPEGAPPNSGPSSPPIEIETGEMRVLSDLIASWPTKVEMQPEIYRRPLKPKVDSQSASTQKRWIWLSLLFFVSCVAGLGWLFLNQHLWMAQPSQQTSKPAKENLPMRSIHDQGNKKKTTTESNTNHKSPTPSSQIKRPKKKKKALSERSGEMQGPGSHKSPQSSSKTPKRHRSPRSRSHNRPHHRYARSN